MSKFAIGFAQTGSARNGTAPEVRLGARTQLQPRINANVRRGFSFRRGYFTVLGLLTLIAVASMSIAIWRLFHFAR
ncbi:MAG TPA: hypothetical protein P5256_18235 [Beijerinckiaceae bacterium]|nr:hypothetical protein [Methylobacteriaceae bacterium]MCO5088666.1 hypothetical protein [Methylobacteriaceae bacterium]HRY05076.1 hypothetical protein [Beijerinckiaceae bacterium]